MGRPRRRPKPSDFHRLCDRQRILQFDAKVPDGAVHLGVTKQKLYRSQISCLSVDLRDLGPAHRMCSVRTRLQTDRFHPIPNKARVLSRGNVKPFVETPWPEVLRSGHQRLFHPAQQRLSRALGDLKTDRFLCFALND